MLAAKLRWGTELTNSASWRHNAGVLAAATSTLSADYHHMIEQSDQSADGAQNAQHGLVLCFKE